MNSGPPSPPGSALWQLPPRSLLTARQGDVRPASPLASPWNHASGYFHGGEVLLGRFEIRRLIGRGGMSLVYSAHDRVRAEDVALKFLSPALLHDQSAVARFQEEARLTIRLRHPRIVQVHEVHEHEGVWFLEMELLPDGTLRDLMRRRQAAGEPFTLAEARQLLNQVGEALAYAHGTTIHRDLKPENLAVLAGGGFRLMDFGLARLLHRPDSQPFRASITLLQAGTPCYMAPESFREGTVPDHRADQYSLGVVLHELLAAELPLGLAAPLARRRPDLPLAFCAALGRALAADPAERFPDVAAMVAELGRTADTRDGWRGWAWRHPRAARRAALAAGVLVLVPALFGGRVLWRRQLESRQAALDGARSELMRREQELTALAQWARERTRETDWLERRQALEAPPPSAAAGILTNRHAWLVRSNELVVARQFQRWLTPQLNHDGQPIEAAALATAARAHWQAGDLPAFAHANRTLAAVAAETHARWTAAHAAEARRHAVAQLHASWTALAAAGRLPQTPAAETEAVAAQFAAGDWEGLERSLRPLLETRLEEARQKFTAAATAWAEEFPRSGPPDLRFIADPAGQAGLAQVLAGAGDWAAAIAQFEDAAATLSAWVGELRALHARTDAAWRALPAADRAESDWGMRFRRLGVGQRDWWSVWETRVLDFAFFLQEEGRGSRDAGTFWQSPGFALSPTQPVVGVDWDTARRFAHWLAQRHPARHWYMGRLPSSGETASLARLLPAAEHPAAGLYPDRTEWSQPHFMEQYRDPRLRAGDYIRPVGMGPANALGLHDFQGNAWEWLADVEDRAREALHYGDSGAWRVQAGGVFGEVSLHGFRPPSPDLRLVARKDAIGFRVVLAVE